MKQLKNPEAIILLILWLCSFTTFSFALFTSHVLFTSDYMGLVGLAIVTAISWFRPRWTLAGLLFLLILGSFNILSFIYFINVVFTFGISSFVTPGIQLLSIGLLAYLYRIRKKQIHELYSGTGEQQEERKERIRQNKLQKFKRTFANLTEEEIDRKLSQELVPEAIDALEEIKKELHNKS